MKNLEGDSNYITTNCNSRPEVDYNDQSYMLRKNDIWCGE